MTSPEIVIDAANALLGRLASYVAKRALLGHNVVVVNCNHVLLSGNKAFIGAHYRARRARGGSALKGPNFPRSPERIVKRTIRGMLPYRQMRGSQAFKRIRCYNDVPEQYASTSLIKAGKEKPIKTMSLEALSKIL
ncbi:MAG: 50S ribosomal protein L13 [Nanoarchaeota archaeon]